MTLGSCFYCLVSAQWLTKVQFSVGEYREGPGLCEKHLHDGIVSLADEFLTVIVMRSDKKP